MNGDMDYTNVRCTTTDRIRTVTLNRPGHLNAFTPTPGVSRGTRTMDCWQ